MISIPFLVCVIGLILWLIFAKTKLSDPWVAEVGRISFFAGLLVTPLRVDSGKYRVLKELRNGVEFFGVGKGVNVFVDSTQKGRSDYDSI